MIKFQCSIQLDDIVLNGLNGPDLVAGRALSSGDNDLIAFIPLRRNTRKNKLRITSNRMNL